MNVLIENFKGIGHLEQEFSGDTVITGRNETGKTSVYDAVLWCLTGKDSLGRASFKAIRDGAERAIVELGIGGKSYRREHYADYVKRRGAASKEFSGYKSEFAVNNVPAKKKDFESSVERDFGGENVVRLCTDIKHFGSLKTADRRKVLSEICDLEAPADVPDGLEIGDYSPEEYVKMMKASLKKTNKKLEGIPERIDEAARGIVDGAKGKIEKAECHLRALEKELEDVERKSSDSGKKELMSRLSLDLTEAQSEIMRAQGDIDSQIAEVEARINEEDRKFRADSDARLSELRAERDSAQEEVDSIASEWREKSSEAEDKKSEIASIEEKNNRLREEYRDVAAEKTDQKCPTCGQNIPGEWAEAAAASRAERLEEINSLGKANKAKLSQLKEELDVVDEALPEIKKRGEEARAKLDSINAEISPKSGGATIDHKNEYKKIDGLKEKRQNLKEVDAVERAKKSLDSARSEASTVDPRVDEIKGKISSCREEIAELKMSERAEKRVEELEEERDDLQQTYDKCAHQLQMAEDYMRSIAKAVEARVNGKFQQVKFQLFEEQINGGLKDTCLILWGGESYDTNLNTGGRINAGIDIASTLSKHYDCDIPVFVDDYESLTKIETDHDRDKVLIEHDKNVEKLEVTNG